MSEPFPEEMQSIKDLLKNLIQASNNMDHIKTHIRYALGLQGDTPEMVQLHSMIVQYDKKFSEASTEREEMKKEMKIIKYALGALALGTPVLQVVLNFLGWM